MAAAVTAIYKKFEKTLMTPEDPYVGIDGIHSFIETGQRLKAVEMRAHDMSKRYGERR